MWQKLTYGGEPNNYLYFGFKADLFDPDIITKELGLNPTTSWVKKDPVPKGCRWNYALESGKDSYMTDLIDELVSIFSPKVDIINRLKEELGLSTELVFVLYVDIDPEESTPCFPLNQKTIEFLYKTGSTVDFDLYKSDSLGLLKELLKLPHSAFPLAN